jgi:hypothetical protein
MWFVSKKSQPAKRDIAAIENDVLRALEVQNDAVTQLRQLLQDVQYRRDELANQRR